MATPAREYSLTHAEMDLLRRNKMGDDIPSQIRQLNRKISKRQGNWTTCDQKYSSNEEISILLFGMGGVGKSALGNLLLGREDAFGVSNKAKAETNEVNAATGTYKGQKVTVYDTPGYLVRQLMTGEADPMDAAKAGIRKIKHGVHILVLVFNASNMRNLESEVSLIKKANLLNPRTFKFCLLVVTHSATAYSSTGVKKFIEDATKSPEFVTLLKNIENRIVLVELGSGEPLSKETLDSGQPFYAAEKEACRGMVFNMMQKTVNDNKHNMYSTANIEQDIKVCFPPLATVITPDGKITMQDLKLKDDVLVVNSQGQVQYEKVIMFSHANPSHTSYFCTISTEDGKVLQLSPGHLMHVGKIGKLTAAQDVKLGDNVFTCDDESSAKLNPVQVTAVSGEWLTGIYCPHTPSGSIIVDGVAASCYTNLLSPTLAHAAMFPVCVAHRLLPDDWFRWMMPYDKEEGMPSLALRVSKMM